MSRAASGGVVRLAPRGIWLGASTVLGKPVPVGEPYPHIHYRDVAGHTGRQVTLMPQDCAACPAVQRKRGKRR